MVIIPMRNVAAPIPSHGIRNLRGRFLRATTTSGIEQTIRLIEMMTTNMKIHKYFMFPAIRRMKFTGKIL
jgi:hypothetical protein